MKTILIGRHAGDLPADIEVISQVNKVWPTELKECVLEVLGTIRMAQRDNIEAILLQNIPGILAVALAHLGRDAGFWEQVKIGVIISRPGPRLAGVVKEFKFSADPDGINASRDALEAAQEAAEAVKFANDRAQVQIDEPTIYTYLRTLTVTVDPVAPFEFDHIEWFSIPEA